jgi:prolipoprotein diacylglyceryl transferase
MYPDLSYFFHDIFGTQPDNWTSIFKTFGLFLVLAILSAAWMLYMELKRKAGEGKFTAEKIKTTIGSPATPWEIISNGIFGFILGWKVSYIAKNFEEFQIDPAALAFSSKGNLIIGIVVGLAFAAFRYWEKEKDKLTPPKVVTENVFPHDRIGDITIIAAITGIAGAKIFALIEDLPTFFADPIGTFFSGSGLAIYGGLIGGTIGVMIYLKKHNIAPIHVMDAVAPALMISYGVGRMGCQFSGDGDWGIVAAAMPDSWFLPEWMWSYTYPHNVNNDGVKIADCAWRYCAELPEGVYPTPIYEIFMSFVIGGFLWAIRKRLLIPGMLFFIYLMFNGIERFIIEGIRVNDRYPYLGLDFSQAQWIAVILFLIGLIGCVVVWQKYKPKA